MIFKKNTKPKTKVQNYIKYSGMVFQMIGIIGLFTFGGYKLDNYYQLQTPIFTSILSVTGVLISLYTIIKSL